MAQVLAIEGSKEEVAFFFAVTNIAEGAHVEAEFLTGQNAGLREETHRLFRRVY